MAGGRGMGLWSVHHMLSLLLLPPHTLPLLQSRVHPTGDILPWNSPAWVLLMGCSSSQTVPAWVLSTGCSPSGADWPTGSQVLPANLLQCGPQPCAVTSTCSCMGSSTGCRWISAPLWTSMGCRGTAYLPLPHRPLCLQSCCSHIFSLLSACSCCCAANFFPLLKYVIPEALPPLLVGLAMASSGSVLEPAGIGSVGHRRIFPQLLTEATHVALLLPKPCCAKPIQLLPKKKPCSLNYQKWRSWVHSKAPSIAKRWEMFSLACSCHSYMLPLRLRFSLQNSN